MKPTVLLVAPERYDWLGLERRLRSDDDVDLLAVTPDVTEATALARRTHPAFIVTGDAPNGYSGPSQVSRLHVVSPTSKIITIGNEPTGERVMEQPRDGACAILEWAHLDDSILHAALSTTESGYFMASPGALRALAGLPERRRHERRADVVLTDEQRRVLKLFGDGNRQPEIAALEHTSEATVVRIMAALRHAFAVPDNVMLVRMAERLGFFD